MSVQELLIGEVKIVSYYVEGLIQRRALGEITSLYAEVRDAADTVVYLRNDVPGILQPQLQKLEARCSTLLRSIAH